MLDMLGALADQCGIEAEFVDARGEIRPTPDTTKRALLTALGVPAGDDASVRAALDALERARWECGLPPVVVALRTDIGIPLVLPRGFGLIRWRITTEAGSARSGIVAFEQCRLLEENDRGPQTYERRELRIAGDLPHGYHRLDITGVAGSMALILTPGRCWLPPAIAAGERLSGLSLQLYLLRSSANWGIGDYTDLRTFAELVAARGGDIVGLNPLHQLFLDDPERASPYSPASRLLLNGLNIDVTAVPEFADCAAAQALLRRADFTARLEACRAAALVAYGDVAMLKLEMLHVLFAAFDTSSPPERRAAFLSYRAGCDPSYERTYVFLALRDRFARQDPARAAWPSWPAEYRDPESAQVANFAQTHADEITFLAWLQWIADCQLGAAAQAARSMRVGLYRDLAVGADPAGAETWSNGRVVVDAARVGAPPDIYNPPGQNWDLPPFHPRALRAEGYRSFIELVRANMRHAGALRIDHVMALARLYWIPLDASPAQGAYVRYPLDDFVGILALESERARCLIVGEDLGTVPQGFRERMASANILSYRVVFFEREPDGTTFTAATAYPALSIAVLGSHDLPTLAAWWNGADIDLRERLGLLDADTGAEQRRQRERDRAALVVLLQRSGALETGRQPDRERLFAAAHALLAQTSAALAVAQLDDVTGETDPVNVPTTSDEHANWRRRLSVSLEELEHDPRVAVVFTEFGAARRLRAR